MSHKFFKFFILNPEGHPNRIVDSKVMAALLNGWSLPVGGVASVKGLRAACVAGLFVIFLQIFIHKILS